MAEFDHWLPWRYNAERKKVPVQLDGSNFADFLNPTKLYAFDRVIDTFRNGGPYSGIGFVFLPENPFFGVDWDHVLYNDSDPMELEYVSPRVREEARSLSTYVEWSPSGRGWHAIGMGNPLADLKSRGHNFGRRELYTEGRFFTVTAVRAL
jgi:primase-polymerase (primpol)-like protein